MQEDDVWSIPGVKDVTATTLQNLLKKKPKEGARFVWSRKEQAEIDMAHILRAAELGLIRSDEFGSILKKMGWELTEPGFKVKKELLHKMVKVYLTVAVDSDVLR